MQRKVRIPAGNNKFLSGILHIPRKLPAPAIIVCHGFTSSKARMEPYCNFFERKGFVALCFDFNSHGGGESYGDFKDMTITKCVKDLAAAVKFLSKQPYVKKIGLMGSSMGGMVVMIYASRNSVSAIVPICPVFNFMKTMTTRDKAAMEEWKKTGERYFDVRVKNGRKRKPLSYNYFLDGKKYDMKKLVQKIRSPIMVVHGDMDKHTLIKDTKLYFRRYLNKPKKLVVLKGAGHNYQFRKKDFDIVFRESAAWLKKYMV